MGETNMCISQMQLHFWPILCQYIFVTPFLVKPNEPKYRFSLIHINPDYLQNLYPYSVSSYANNGLNPKEHTL